MDNQKYLQKLILFLIVIMCFLLACLYKLSVKIFELSDTTQIVILSVTLAIVTAFLVWIFSKLKHFK